jgi:hypothetical protein
MSPSHRSVGLVALFFFLFFGAAICSPAYAQLESDVLLNAYYQASRYPDGFDSYVARTPALKTEEFRRCWVSAKLRLVTRWHQDTKYCDRLPEIGQRIKCKDTNDLKASNVLDDIGAATRQEALYTETVTGRAAVVARKLCELAYGASGCEGLIAQEMTRVKEDFTCK